MSEEWSTDEAPDAIKLLEGGRVVIVTEETRWELTVPSMRTMRALLEGIHDCTQISMRSGIAAAEARAASDEDLPAMLVAAERIQDEAEERCAVVFAEAINATKRDGPEAVADELPVWAGLMANLAGVRDWWRGNRLAPGA